MSIVARVAVIRCSRTDSGGAGYWKFAGGMFVRLVIMAA
jgi:hypothetical protein